jgi:hypothetical protein
LEAQGIQLRFLVPGEPFSRRLFNLANVFDRGFGKLSQLRIEAAEEAKLDSGFVLVFGRGDCIPGSAKLLLPLRIGHYKRTEIALFLFLFLRRFVY